MLSRFLIINFMGFVGTSSFSWRLSLNLEEFGVGSTDCFGSINLINFINNDSVAIGLPECASLPMVGYLC